MNNRVGVHWLRRTKQVYINVIIITRGDFLPGVRRVAALAQLETGFLLRVILRQQPLGNVGGHQFC